MFLDHWREIMFKKNKKQIYIRLHVYTLLLQINKPRIVGATSVCTITISLVWPDKSCGMTSGLNVQRAGRQLLWSFTLRHGRLCYCISAAPGACDATCRLLGQFSLFTSPPSSAPQVWPMQCWLLCLQFMACTPHSTRSCSTPSLVHPDTYP